MSDIKVPICNCVNCQGKVMERGLFVFDGVHTIQSDDFSHDVSITFNGDMLPGDYERYGEWLTKVLNAATALETACDHKWGEYAIDNAKSPADPPERYVWYKCIKCGEPQVNTANRGGKP